MTAAGERQFEEALLLQADKTGSTESCRVSIAQPTTIGVMLNGYAAGTFKLVGKKI